MTEPHIIEESADVALALLREGFPSVRAITETTSLKDTQRTLVLRCTLAVSGEEAPSTVIVKKMLTGEERGFSDWSSLEFIGMAPERAGIAPRFHAGDRAKGIYIIEDLGGSESLDDLLRREDRAAATDALLLLAGRCAKLNRTTVGAEHERVFDEIRGGFPGAGELGRHREGERWKGALERVRGWFTSATTELGERFDAECARLNARYMEPGAFLGFTHGDMAPSNNHLRDGEVRLIDFEYGGYRHALYDMAVWNVLCPLPASLLEPMLEHYRACWMEGSDCGREEFAMEWRRICTWRGMAMLGWFSPAIIEKNRPWVEEWSSRDALLRTVRMIARCALQLDEIPGIAGSFARLADALADLWSDTEGSIPRWRALDGMGA